MTAAATYAIGDLAAEFDVTPRTIRHYEDEGLIRPARDGTRRIFSHRDRVRLKLVLLATRLGFSLGEVRELFELHDRAGAEPALAEAFLAKLDTHRARLEQQRADAELMLNEIGFFAAQCRRALATGAPPAPVGTRMRPRTKN